MSEILASDGDLYTKFDSVEAAAENELLPPAWYTCRLDDIRPDQSAKKLTPSVTLEWTVIEGDHAKRKVWQSLWLTENALSRTKRDLAKLGITNLDQIEDGITAKITASVLVGERRDDGGEYDPKNEIRRFKVLAVEELDGVDDDEFPPPPAGAADAASGEGK